MFSEADLINEVSAIVDSHLDAGLQVRAQWLTQQVITKHSSIDGADKDFYTLCAWHHVKDAVRDVLRRYKEDPEKNADPNITLPGFERLQKGYLIEREKESVLVPIDQLSDEELEAKAVEYERMAEGCRLHAAELRRYRRQRGSAA